MNLTLSSVVLEVGGRRLLRTGDFRFVPGNVHCIGGRSGTGKTSLLRVLIGTEGARLAEGLVRFEKGGAGYAKANGFQPQRGQDIVLMQQGAPLWPHCTAYENAWMPWALQGGVYGFWERRRKAQARAAQRLEQLHLSREIWSRNAGRLSGGERRRVALAAALVFESHCLLLDEPTANLDRESTDAICSLLSQAATDHLLIVTTHDPDLLSRDSGWIQLRIEASESHQTESMLVPARVT